MDAIYIPRLIHWPDQTEILEFKEIIPALETLTPVQGQIQVAHRGTYLEISGVAETIVTLTCDRCLQQYNYRLAISPQEMIWLDDTVQSENLLFDKDLDAEDLVETLSPTAHFHPTTWIYEQLCLELPFRKLCDANCEGIELVPEAPGPLPDALPVDSRWSALIALKDQLPDLN
jgi:uncharacterized protein